VTRISIPVLLCAALLLTLPACKPEPPAGGPAAAASSAPIVSAALPGTPLNLEAGFDLATVKNQSMIDPQFRLMDPEVSRPLIFAAVRNPDTKTTTPVIVRRSLAGWKIIELAALPNHEWVHVAACPARQELWGFLDAFDDNSAPRLAIVRSTDGGLTWQYWRSLKKPVPDAEYGGFSLAKSGQGRLTLHLEEDAGPTLHGYYHYNTTDGGDTWTGPTFEADDVSTADELKEFDTLPEALKATETAATQP
jgi:hypothetical protein